MQNEPTRDGGLITYGKGDKKARVYCTESSFGGVATNISQPIISLVVPPTIAIAMDDGLRQEMKKVVDLMKNLQGHGRQANQPNGDGG